ncbi:MAG TPA: hypothetical protein GXX75_05720 [Clostridiales bacterium]|nr:hypothetical protein [Clostridiales bacterium]
MELYERRDFIQIDYHDNNFVVVSIRGIQPLDNDLKDKADFGILQRFGDNLEEAIKFAIGAMSAVRLFIEGIYRPVDYLEIVYTDNAKLRIKNKKYRVAEFIYPDLKLLKKGW